MTRKAVGLVERLAATAGDGVDLPTSHLARTVALCHDLGHPPFGHSGEVALDRCMAEHGGFEGNGQTLRIISRLEHYSEGYGFDLTRRAMLGVLKYPVGYARAVAVRGAVEGPSKPPKCYLDSERDVVDWLLADLVPDDAERFQETEEASGRLRTAHVTLDCSIMEIADDVAYGVHDLEDAVALGLVTGDAFYAAMDRALRPFLGWLERGGIWSAPTALAFGADLFGAERARKRSIGRLVHYMMASARCVTVHGFKHPLLRKRAFLAEEARELLDELKRLVTKAVILRPSVQQLEFKGRRVVEAAFEAYRSDPMRLLPVASRAAFERSNEPERVICDHIASLTDDGLLRIYERLFVAGAGSPFDML